MDIVVNLTADTTTMNRVIYLKQTPAAELLPAHFELREEADPTAGEGQVLVRNVLMSIDAANRAWMQGPTYRDQVKPGDPMATYTLGEVIDSKVSSFKAGDIVLADAIWADRFAVSPAALTPMPNHRPLSHLHSVMGIAGLTAYHGLLKHGQPESGETVVVSAAAGSVGSFVGQIAKIKGCRVVGIAGGAEKVNWVKSELGFDDCIDYKSGDVAEALQSACPKGIDVYFDNVGGDILEAVMMQMNDFGRIACCGAISAYEKGNPPRVTAFPMAVVVKRLKVSGFIVMDHAAEHAQAMADLGQWAASGQLKVAEDIVDGLENAPQALIGLLNGNNRGKRMVRVGPDPA